MAIGSKTDIIDKICTNFADVINDLSAKRVLTKAILTDSELMKLHLHGLLESAFVKAGWLSGLSPVIEPRVPLSKFLIPSEYNQKLKNRPRKHVRPDVGYFKGNSLCIFAEVNTLDGVMSYRSSSETNYLTKRDVYTHFVQHSVEKVEGFLICVTLPIHVTRKPRWTEQNDLGPNYFSQLSQHWHDLSQDLRRHTDARLIIIEENGIHFDSTFRSVSLT